LVFIFCIQIIKYYLLYMFILTACMNDLSFNIRKLIFIFFKCPYLCKTNIGIVKTYLLIYRRREHGEMYSYFLIFCLLYISYKHNWWKIRNSLVGVFIRVSYNNALFIFFLHVRMEWLDVWLLWLVVSESVFK